MLRSVCATQSLGWRMYCYCLAAGCWSAGGSFFGKLPNFLLKSTGHLNEYSVVCCQLVCFSLMVFCNLCNLRSILKAMQYCDNTITPIALTTATNYLMSFVLAKAIYREEFSSLSLLGLGIILLGLWLLLFSDNRVNDKNKYQD